MRSPARCGASATTVGTRCASASTRCAGMRGCSGGSCSRRSTVLPRTACPTARGPSPRTQCPDPLRHPALSRRPLTRAPAGSSILRRMPCLVTGGAGFLGAHVARALLNAGHDVVVLDDLSGGFVDNVDPRARLVTGSIVDHEAVDALFAAERFDHVFHLAAYAAEGLSPFIKRFNYTNNVIGSVNLINASINFDVRCFVFTSSIAVYGSGQVPMTEDLLPQPEDSYGIAKYAVEQELRASHEFFGLDYVIFRPHNVYGELQNIGDRYRN